jgi:hypothetical protein
VELAAGVPAPALLELEVAGFGEAGLALLALDQLWVVVNPQLLAGGLDLLGAGEAQGFVAAGVVQQNQVAFDVPQAFIPSKEAICHILKQKGNTS